LLILWIVFIGYQATKIERQHFELQQEQKALRELEQLKNNFVSLISHDLKTPLAKIEAIAQRLLTHPKATEFRPDLDALTESSAELNHYIQSVLRLLRVESRDFRIHLESSEINEIIEEALLQVAPLARNKRIRLEKDLEPMFLAEFDPVLIKEVIVNLLDNAIKYTQPDGRVIILSKEISNGTESYIQVTVEDSGSGIPDHEVDNVWLKFVRGRDQEMKTKGTGLGLYLVKYFVELHRGRVAIESRMGIGTKVDFTLPLQLETPTVSPYS
jgi:signal transduction histidine kinase